MEDKRLWKSDQEDGTFLNPILFADYSDPDVIRVGDTYYLTASSFNYTPALPILISKDLVNWHLVNYALKNINEDSYEVPRHACGVWAPAIRYHEGVFYIFYGMPDEGIYRVAAKDPLGKWDDPVLLLKGKGFIDPCPFWDEDGRAYVVHGYARSRIGFKSFLGMFEMSWDATQKVSEDRLIYDGTKTQPTIEGPKVYKRKGYYYLFAPAGSVKTGWQTVLRSKTLRGPFEERVVMAQGTTSVNGPHQGGLVDTPYGDEWFLHFQDMGFYGRICHLQPVRWVDDWPIIGVNPDEMGCGEPVLRCDKPGIGAYVNKHGQGSKEMRIGLDEAQSIGTQVADSQQMRIEGADSQLMENQFPYNLDLVRPTYLEATDYFEDPKLNLMWQWLGNHRDSFYSLEARPGYLRLYAINTSHQDQPTLWTSANVLTQKFICPSFEAKTKFHISHLEEGDWAGLCVIGGQYAYLALEIKNGQIRLIFGQSRDDGKGKAEDQELLGIYQGLESIHFHTKLIRDEDQAYMVFGYDLENEITWLERVFIPSDHTWVGSKLGLFALHQSNESSEGYLDVASFEVKPYQ